MEKKFNHDSNDFIEAFGLDKSEMVDAVEIGFRNHLINGKSLSVSMLQVIEKIKGKKPTEDDIKLMCAGMMLSQSLISIKDTGLGTLLKKALGNSKSDLPFTADDLMKSVRDELNGNSNKKGPKSDQN